MKKIYLGGKHRDKFIILDNTDYLFFKDYKVHFNLGYGCFTDKVTKKTVRVHRFIMDCPANLRVDHINHNKLDNRRSNLRVCTSQQNTWNSIRGGVYPYHKKTNFWQTKICVNGKQIWLGFYPSKRQALKVYRNACNKYFRTFSPYYKVFPLTPTSL